MSFQESSTNLKKINGNEIFEASQFQRRRRRFVQLETSEEINQAWRQLFKESKCAGTVMNEIVRNLGPHNAVCASQKTLAILTSYSVRSIVRAMKHLVDHQWIQVVQLNGKGDVNCYVVNDRVAWADKRHKLQYSKFSATILASSLDQNKQQKGALRRIPTLSSMSEGYDKNDR